MANLLLIEKQTGGYFKFTLNGDTANAVTSIYNDLLAVGNQLHFKTGNGANIIKEQFIYPQDVTVIASGTFTFTTVAQVWDKLIDIDYFAWLGNGGGGIDRFDDLVDTFKYTGNAGKTVIVDNSELKLVPVTLYNKRLFTELEDTPSSLVPNKMLVVNPAGTAVVLQDQPEPPEALLNSVGYFDYNDLITQTIPLVAIANTPLKLTNDTEGANTSTDQNPYGVSYVWDYTTNQFNFSELSVGDTIDVRVHVQITTTGANQKVSMSAKFGIGSVSEFTNAIYENQFKTAGLHEVSFVAPFYMGSEYITDYPAELYLTTDASATVKIDGWYIRILRKNINIITVDYEVPDATTLTKGIVRLAGDLAGTANAPTVPELANKQNKLNGTGFVKASGTTISYDNTSYLPLTGGTVTGTLNVDGSGATTPAITSIFNTGINRLLTPVLRLYGLDNIASKYIELYGSLATSNRTIQFPDASGTVALISQVITGSGTTNYIPKFTSSSSIGNSLIYEIGSTIGIGTTSPFSALHIKRNASELLRITRGSESDFSFDLGASNDLYIKNNGIGTTPLTILGSGNVGIGTMTPTNKLHIVGDSFTNSRLVLQRTSGAIGKYTLGVQNESGQFGIADESSGTSIDRFVIGPTGYVGIGTSSPTKIIHIYGTDDASSSMLFERPGVSALTVGSNYISSSTTFRVFTSNTSRIMVLANGNVGIGTDTPSYKLHVNGSVAGTSAYVNLSDKRHKKDILPIENALDKILALNGVTFNWDKESTDMNLDDNNHIGLLAQDVEQIIPQAVVTAEDENETKSDAYTDIVPVLIEAIKELKAEIELLKAK